MEPTLDVVGVGNAIVDVIAQVPEDFIGEHGLAKGAMTLIDAQRADELYAAMPPGIEASGGSAANTMAGIASFGGRGAYFGKIRDDQLGEVFKHDMAAVGVEVGHLQPSSDGPSTARCLIQVTPDAERTLNTFLGISAFLEPDDLDAELIESAAITFCEGYLWDVDIAKASIRSAMDIARSADRMVSLTLSDSFCVDRHRAEWLDLLSDRVDLVFANEREVCSLFETDDWAAARDRIRDLCDISVLTRSEKGSVVVRGSETVEVPAARVDNVVDATGAGDLYAAGFLYGLSHDHDLARCAELGGLAAAEVISHVGARSLVSLATFAAD